MVGFGGKTGITREGFIDEKIRKSIIEDDFLQDSHVWMAETVMPNIRTDLLADIRLRWMSFSKKVKSVFNCAPKQGSPDFLILHDT